jgi:iron complex outermembrane receptor protein
VGEVYLYGAEAQIKILFSKSLDGGLSYTYTQWDNRSNSEKITDVPAHKINTYLHYTLLEKVGLTLDGEHYSGRYSSSDGVRETESFTLANIKADVLLSKGFKIEGGVENVFDKDYEIEEGYPEAGASYYANLTYRY